MGAFPLNIAVMLGSDINVLTKVIKVEPPSAVVDEPYCIVGIDWVPLFVVALVVLVFRITRLLSEYRFALLRFRSAYISMALPGVKLLRASAYKM
jgi:hypothetical protein